MPRKPRLEYEGAVYHVMDREDRLETIFLGPEDRVLFLKTLGQARERTDCGAICSKGDTKPFR